MGKTLCIAGYQSPPWLRSWSSKPVVEETISYINGGAKAVLTENFPRKFDRVMPKYVSLVQPTQSIDQRWRNIVDFEPTDIFIFRGGSGPESKRMIWLELLFAFSSKARGLYTTNHLEGDLYNCDHDNPILLKQFRSFVVATKEVPYLKTDPAREVDIIYYDLELMRKYMRR